MVTRTQLFEYLIDCLGYDSQMIDGLGDYSTQYIAENCLSQEEWLECLKFSK